MLCNINGGGDVWEVFVRHSKRSLRVICSSETYSSMISVQVVDSSFTAKQNYSINPAEAVSTVTGT